MSETLVLHILLSISRRSLGLYFQRAERGKRGIEKKVSEQQMRKKDLKLKKQILWESKATSAYLDVMKIQ